MNLTIRELMKEKKEARAEGYAQGIEDVAKIVKGIDTWDKSGNSIAEEIIIKIRALLSRGSR